MQESRPNRRGTSLLECLKCRKLFLTAEERISHARTKHNVDQTEYPCLDCKIVGYVSQKHLEKHIQTRCPGRGWETRIEKSPQADFHHDSCSAKSNAHPDKSIPKTTLNSEPLLMNKFPKKSPVSSPALQDRRFSLRSAQSEDPANDKNRYHNLKCSWKSSIPRKEVSANRLSEVPSSNESPSIGARMSTRIHSMPSSEQKQTQSTDDSNLNFLEPSNSKIYKTKRQKASYNSTTSDDLGPIDDPLNSKKRSSMKSRDATVKSSKCIDDASKYLRASIELTSDPEFLNELNRSHTSPLPQTSLNESPKSITSSKQSIKHKFADAPLHLKRPRTTAEQRLSSNSLKKVPSKLSPRTSAVRHKISQNRTCKKPGSKNSPSCRITLANSSDFVGKVPSISDFGNQSSTGHYSPPHPENEASNTEVVKVPSSKALPFPELLTNLALGSLKQSEEALNSIKTKEDQNDGPLASSKESDKFQAENESHVTIMLINAAQKRAPESLLEPNAKSSSTPLETTAAVKMATNGFGMPYLPLQASIKYSPERINKSLKLTPNSLPMNPESISKSKSFLSEACSPSNVKALASEQDPCNAIPTYEPESPEATISNKGSELKPVQKALGVAEMVKQPNFTKATDSDTKTMDLSSTVTLTPTIVTSSTTAASTTISSAAKVALMDWDSFIATDPRKACRNSVSASTATNTVPTTQKRIKPPLKRQSHSSAMASDRSLYKSTSQMAERLLQHTQKEPAEEAIESAKTPVHPPSTEGDGDVCCRETEAVTQNGGPFISSPDNSDCNSDATAPAINSSQDLPIPPVYDGDVESGQSPQRYLRPRMSINYSNSKQKAKIEINKKSNNYEGSIDDTTKQDESVSDEEEDEEDASQRNVKKEEKHMTTHCCPVCRLTGFVTLAELRVHRTISCRRKGKNPKRLNRRNIEWYCPGCQNSQNPFQSAVALLAHLLTCRKRRPGGKVFKTDHPTLSSDRLCPSTLCGPSTTFGCSICGAIVASESRLDKHRRDEHDH